MDEMHALEDLQRQIWSGTDDDAVPAHILLAIAHNGGLVLGGYRAGELLGFACSFPGLDQVGEARQLKHVSHILGVLPQAQGQGLGFALKQAQRSLVMQQGIPLITWTYDPLLSRNAYLNIHRLGAVCRTYFRDYYGVMHDDLNRGLPSDRFQVEWWLDTERAEACSRAAPSATERLPQVVNPAFAGGQGWLEPADDPGGSDLAALPQEAAVEIPVDFLALKAADPELALAWRLHTRLWFETLFSQGFMVVDYTVQPGSPGRGYYCLSRQPIQGEKQ